jgi:hypothetical protein
MLSSKQKESSKALEITMRDSMGAMEELSLHALFSMNDSAFEVISINSAPPKQKATVELNVVQ